MRAQFGATRTAEEIIHDYIFDITSPMPSITAVSCGISETGAPGPISLSYPDRAAASPSPHAAMATFGLGAEEVLREAETNPLELLLALRASESPLHSIQIPSGILAVASMIADGGDSPGIEPDELELLLRAVIYLDHLTRKL